MKVAKNVSMLRIKGQNMIVHPVLIWDEKEIVLIDCGFPGTLEQIEKQLDDYGLKVEHLTKLILTHQDMDHIGCVNDIRVKSPNAQVFAHEIEIPYMNGTETPIRIAQQEAKFDELTEEKKKFLESSRNAYSSRQLESAIPLRDEEVLPECGGIEIVYTPGHMPGHICLYLKESKTLITGDAMVMNSTTLSGPSPLYTIDMNAACESLKKLQNLDIDQVICYHGGLYTNNPNQTIKDLLENPS